MSGKLKELDGRSEALGQLGTVMAAMRGVASMRTQQALGILPAIRAYQATVEKSLRQLIAVLPDEPVSTGIRVEGRLGIVLFSVEHGFAGGYPERLAETVEGFIAKDSMVFLAGARGIRLALERGWRVAWSGPMASQTAAVGQVALAVADALYRAVSADEVSEVVLVHGRAGPALTQQIIHRSLLPVDLSGLRSIAPPGPGPLLGLPPERLLDRLTQEYIMGALTEAAMESFAAENAARLATMEAARTHIADQLEELEGEARRLRQEETTGELMDVVAGWRAAIRTESSVAPSPSCT